MNRRCIALYSGGLDSRLALRLMVEQGIDTIAFHALQVFAGNTPEAKERAATDSACRALGASDVIFRSTTADMIELTKHPRHGYGKHLNACLDCRATVMKHAKAVMEEVGADFIVSGEVLGQRPKSQQRRGLAVIDKAIDRLGLTGLLVRPLSAKLLDPTIPEQEGWIDREQLYDISGRSRQPQMQLAKQFGITDYPQPAGGCLLTDAGFCARLADTMEHEPNWGAETAALLKVGRHYRLGPQTRMVIARNAEEGDRLDELASAGDYLFITADRPGALVLLRGASDDSALAIARGMAVYHSKFRDAGRATVQETLRQTDETPSVRMHTDCPAVLPDTIDDRAIRAAT